MKKKEKRGNIEPISETENVRELTEKDYERLAKKAADSKARIKARETPESIVRAERFKKLLKKEDAVRPLVEAMRTPKTNKEDLISEIAKKADLTIHQVKSILEENQLI